MFLPAVILITKRACIELNQTFFDSKEFFETGILKSWQGENPGEVSLKEMDESMQLSALKKGYDNCLKKEYQLVHSVHALHGYLRTSFNVGYMGRFGQLAGKWDPIFKGRLDAPAAENYFGKGNNSVLVNNTRNYYRTFSQRVYGGIGFQRNFKTRHHAQVSLVYLSVK